MVKPTGWVVDMRHYIDENTGDLPEVIPERVLSLAIFFGAIVAWVTDHLPDGDEHTNVPCRRMPGRRRCRGDIIAQLDRPSGYIVWQCPLCGDHGMIHGWEDTLWNRSTDASHGPPLHHRPRRTDAVASGIPRQLRDSEARAGLISGAASADVMPVSDRDTLGGLTQFPRTRIVTNRKPLKPRLIDSRYEICRRV